MITLDVKEYCQECRAFSPVAVKANMIAENGTTEIETVVRCENAKKCAVLVKYLTHQIQNDLNDNAL